MGSVSTSLRWLKRRVKASAHIESIVSATAFWLAVGLPFGYVPLLWRGLTGTDNILFVGLVVTNVTALIVGHDYDP